MNREQIRQKIKEIPSKQEVVELPEWECKVLIKELSAKSYLEIAEKGNSQSLAIPLLIINSVYTEDGERLFSQKDTDLLLELPPSIFSILVLAINKLNGFDTPKN